MNKRQVYHTYYAPDISGTNFTDPHMMLPESDYLRPMDLVEGVNTPYLYIGMFIAFTSKLKTSLTYIVYRETRIFIRVARRGHELSLP